MDGSWRQIASFSKSLEEVISPVFLNGLSAPQLISIFMNQLFVNMEDCIHSFLEEGAHSVAIDDPLLGTYLPAS